MQSFKFQMMKILCWISTFYCIARLRLAIWLVNSRSIQNRIGPRKCVLNHKCKDYQILQLGRIFVWKSLTKNFHVLTWVTVTDNFLKIYLVWEPAWNFPKISWKIPFYFFIRLSLEWPYCIFHQFSESFLRLSYPDNFPKILLSFIVLYSKALINQLFSLYGKHSDLYC